jgi:hypothetical protein
MLSILLQTVLYLFRPTVKSWRLLRTALMARLPKAEKEADLENGK